MATLRSFQTWYPVAQTPSIISISMSRFSPPLSLIYCPPLSSVLIHRPSHEHLSNVHRTTYTPHPGGQIPQPTKRTHGTLNLAALKLHASTWSSPNPIPSAPGGTTKHLLQPARKSDPKARKQTRQCAAGDERHNNQHEDFHGMSLHVVDEIPQETAELCVCAFEIAGARGALVVGGGATCADS